MRHLPTLGLAVVLLVLAGAASGADGDPYLKSCYSTANAAPCTQLQPPFQAADAEVSSDGRHLYVAVWDLGGGFNGLRLFDVGTGGSITPRAGAAVATQQGPYDIDFSPDGQSVYVAAGNQLVVLARDPASGTLAQRQCFGAPPCFSVTGQSSFHSVAVSPDAASVYARGSNQLLSFDRNASTGNLVQKLGVAGCIAEEAALPCASGVGIAGSGFETVVSPDGRYVYTSNQTPGGVAMFTRATNGSVSQIAGTTGGCVTTGGTSGAAGGTECVAASPTLTQAWAANLDRQGAFVVVSAAGGNTVFRRDQTNGRLTQTDCVYEVGTPAPLGACHEVKGAAGSDAAVSPDGNHVVLNASGLGLSFLTLNRTTGRLAQRASRGCFAASPAPPCQNVPGLLGGLGSVALSPNGIYVFAAVRVPPGNGGSVVSFERDVAPRCRNRSITVRRRPPLWVPLACTDANGDRVTLAIAAPPLFGLLGKVDQAKDRVRYTPDATRKGRDTFRYRGTARGSSGPAATVTLKVLAKPARADRTPPNTRITAGPPPTTTSRAARFTFTSTERGSDFQCKPDWQKLWSSCSSPKRYSPVRPGSHAFQVRAVDSAGNVDRTPAKHVWTATS
jgi:DNA-binding beta-propeller fold protein YncE